MHPAKSALCNQDKAVLFSSCLNNFIENYQYGQTAQLGTSLFYSFDLVAFLWIYLSVSILVTNVWLIAAHPARRAIQTTKVPNNIFTCFQSGGVGGRGGAGGYERGPCPSRVRPGHGGRATESIMGGWDGGERGWVYKGLLPGSCVRVEVCVCVVCIVQGPGTL